ncbi:hypothetical protein GCM10010520_66800 [Rhizobium viscosum]
MRGEVGGKSTGAATLPAVISVLVTEIQPSRVCAVNGSFSAKEEGEVDGHIIADGERSYVGCVQVLGEERKLLRFDQRLE